MLFTCALRLNSVLGANLRPSRRMDSISMVSLAAIATIPSRAPRAFSGLSKGSRHHRFRGDSSGSRASVPAVRARYWARILRQARPPARPIEEPGTTRECRLRRALHLEQTRQPFLGSLVLELVVLEKLLADFRPLVGEEPPCCFECVMRIGDEWRGKSFVYRRRMIRHELHRSAQRPTPLLIRGLVETAPAIRAPAFDPMRTTP